jgi:hypothetical protein
MAGRLKLIEATTSMNADLIEAVGKYAGLAGFSLGLILLVFRTLLKSNIFPTLNNEQGYSLMRLLIVCTFSAGIIGVAAWTLTQPREKTAVTVHPPDTPDMVSGHVIDKMTKEAVDGSVVVLGGRTERTRTDDAGNFSLDLIPPSPKVGIHLFLSKQGYEPFDLHVSAGQNIDVDLIPLKRPKQADLTPAKAPTATVANKGEYDKGLKHFYWLYSFDAQGHQRRDWYQESSSTWNEVYEDGRIVHSRVVDANATVEGNDGIICVGDNLTLRLFIPNPGAHGVNPTWLRFQDPGSDHWSLIGSLVWVRTQGNPPQTAK